MSTREQIRRGAGAVQRRGLLAGAVVLLGAGLAKLAGPGRADAAHDTNIDYNSQTVLHADQINTVSSRTTVKSESGTTPLVVQNTSADTPQGQSAIFGATSRPNSGGTQGGGIQGLSTGASGMGAIGTAEAANGIGVYGAAARKFVTESGPGGTGVFGFGPGNGVAGRSDSIGVRGLSTPGTGVFGSSESGVGTIGTSISAAGMYGFSRSGVGAYGTSPTSVGLFGEGTQSAGVFGVSPVYGVWGRTTTGIGVNGDAEGAGIGVYGRAGAGGFAGYFLGNVYVSGTVLQGGASGPQAAVAGSAAMTAEDVGEAQLVNGSALVTLDSAFAEGAKDGGYLVFLTEEDDHNALFVTKKGTTSFEVWAKGAPNAGSRFNYRAVAKRRRERARDTAPGGERGAASSIAETSVTLPRNVPVPTPPALPDGMESAVPRGQR